MSISLSSTRVSAIITVYNSASYISAAIDSVLAQTRPVDEIVVIDDGSTDETAAIVAGYAARDVRYVYQENQGAGAARNRGIRETCGDYIAFLDGDDLWQPNKIELQLTYLQNYPEVVLVSGQQIHWNVETGEQHLKRYGLPLRGHPRREILVHNYVGNPSMVLLRRSILDITGPFSTLRWGQDWELWIRIVMQAPISFVPEPVILYRWHDAGLTHNKRWERLACLLEISKQAVRVYTPVWWRPLLLARVMSNTAFRRAGYTHKRCYPRHHQLWYAGSALLLYPFENTAEKLKILGRVVAGSTLYSTARRLRMARLR